ncbi:MAG: hypothetical protein ACSHXH_15195 [Marivita sp.]|uniref:hypothetical protein n=1 Tax=Marivita sp. TaxID=2003365 RepID=UPI003EF8829A
MGIQIPLILTKRIKRTNRASGASFRLGWHVSCVSVLIHVNAEGVRATYSDQADIGPKTDAPFVTSSIQKGRHIDGN